MKHPSRPSRLFIPALLDLTAWVQMARDRAGRTDRGSSVVETIILVAGFAGVAFVIYLAVKGKVASWIAKIPGDTAP